MNAGTLSSRHYALRVVSNGHFVTSLEFYYMTMRRVPYQRPRRAPVLQFIAQPVPVEKAESFEGGPRLDAIIREAEEGQMDLFPVPVDR